MSLLTIEGTAGRRPGCLYSNGALGTAFGHHAPEDHD
jgi:hypothetical protein